MAVTVPSLFLKAVGTLAAMADVQPFRAVRYTGAAGPLEDLVAPPYDAVDEDERARLHMRSPYNVVHLTLPESADEAGRIYRSWLADGVLEQDAEPAIWLVSESYVGPDGVSRERRGAIVSLVAAPYETGTVLPHERTHPRIRDERLSLLRATRVQPEPILVLADRALTVERPSRDADIDVDGRRLWRADLPWGHDVGQLVIADGHHRYESAVGLVDELGPEGSRIMALVVSADDPGLHVFATHRMFVDRPDLAETDEGEPHRDLDEALSALGDEPFGRSAAIAYRAGRVELVRGGEGELDTELIERRGLDGIRYTPRADEAVRAVDEGAADVAFIVREPRVEDVFAVARQGRRMPPKSTYFYPKPLSGIVFHPLER
jgi:uncharacterized protein (DUF1015 family)